MKVSLRYGAGSFLLLLAFFFSCEEPEPYFNKNAQPPEVNELNIQEIKEGQHIAGFCIINFTPEIPATEINSVSLIIDGLDVFSTPYASLSPYRYQLELNTKQWPEGQHEVSIGIREINPPDLGLLNLVATPSILYTASVVFDQSPPTPVTLESVEWDADAQSPILTWDKNQDLNFYAYIVYKEEIPYGTFIDTIYDQSVLSFIDPSHNGAIGISCKYKIIVWNRDQMAESNAVPFHYPEVLPVSALAFYGFVRPIQSHVRDEMYVLGQDGITAVSTPANAILRTYPMPNKYPKNFALSRDGSELYILATYSPTITVLEASTFEVLRTADPYGYSASSVVCGRADRLYLTTGGSLKVLDANTLGVVSELDVHAPDGLMTISSDNNTLYVADASPTLYEQAKIYVVDISSDELEVVNEKSASDWVRGIQLSADDQTLYLLHDFDYPVPTNNYVDCWDPVTLTSVKKFNTPSQVFDFVANDESIFIIYGNPTLMHFEPGGLLQYNLTTDDLINTWGFMLAPNVIQVSRDKSTLYVFGSETWIVNIP